MTNQPPSEFIEEPNAVNEYLSRHGLHPKLADTKFQMKRDAKDFGIHTFDVPDHHGFIAHCVANNSSVIILYRKDEIDWMGIINAVNINTTNEREVT